jgi:Na+/H+ antiporter NhaA
MTSTRSGKRLFGVVVRPLQAFLQLEAASSVLLLAAAVFAFAWANVDPSSYQQIVEFPLSIGAGGAEGHFTTGQLVNDGLMALLLATLATPVAMGTALGLFFGKQVGVFVPAALAVRLGIAPMPGGSKYSSLYGVSIVAGIGFTVALFIATLGFRESPQLLAEAKVGILVGSLVSGIVGAAVLRLAALTTHSPRAASEHPAPTSPAPAARTP